MPAALAAANRRPRLSTVLCCVTLSPTAPQTTPFGLRKSICGSITTSAVRARSSFMSDGGSIGLAGSAYLSVAVAALAAVAAPTAADASAAVTAAPLFRKLRRGALSGAVGSASWA